MRTWDIREPVMSLTYRAITPSSASDKTDVDGEADTDSKPIARRAGDRLGGLLRKVVWPVSGVGSFCCAYDECYL